MCVKQHTHLDREDRVPEQSIAKVPYRRTTRGSKSISSDCCKISIVLSIACSLAISFLLVAVAKEVER